MADGHKIALIGRGKVGGALAKGLQGAGYEVRATGKDPAQVRQAAAWGDIVVLAVPYGARRNAIEAAGPPALEGKVLVDVTNALGDGLAFAGSPERSGAQEVQEWAGEGCRVVKAFNTVLANHMSAGSLGGQPLTLFAAGRDAEAKGQVLRLGRDLGFDAVDAGDLAAARWLEALGYLNIHLAFAAGLGADSGFRYLHGEAAQAGGAAQRPRRTGSRTEPRPRARAAPKRAKAGRAGLKPQRSAGRAPASRRSGR